GDEGKPKAQRIGIIRASMRGKEKPEKPQEAQKAADQPELQPLKHICSVNKLWFLIKPDSLIKASASGGFFSQLRSQLPPRLQLTSGVLSHYKRAQKKRVKTETALIAPAASSASAATASVAAWRPRPAAASSPAAASAAASGCRLKTGFATWPGLL